MTVTAEHTAFISLGLGCQAAYQLNANIDFLSERMGCRFQYQSSFFNWLLSDCEGIASFIREQAGRELPEIVRGATFMPIQVSNYRLWLWHEGQSEAINDAAFGQIASKYNHLLQKFWALRSVRRRYFIVSNCQNNLSATLANSLFKFNLSATIADAIEQAVNSCFSDGDNVFLYACYRDRIDGPPRKDFYLMERDESEWTGSTENWRRFLSSRLPENTN